MKHVLAAAAAVLLMGTLSGCGGSTANDEPADPNATGEVHLSLNGSISTDSGTMATIVIRNVFDHTQNFLIECNEKDHTLPDGEPFCDELTILPPGVYEVIVQSGDPNCVPEQEWYKVIVEPGETVELTVNLICGGANGGLDVIVTETEPPVVTDINFSYYWHPEIPANKFICRDRGPVDVDVTVYDSDTACADLTYNWTAAILDSGVAVPVNALISATSKTPVIENGEEVGCLFTATLIPNPALPDDDFELTLHVTDDQGNQMSFSFPIHYITCADAGQ